MQSSTPVSSYPQGAVVWVSFPLTDKIDKLKRRPALIVSNSQSNELDNDYIALPITKAIREEAFSLLIDSADITGELPIQSEIRCNKPFTVRSLLIHELIGFLSANKIAQAVALAQAAISPENTSTVG
jgi:mRNA-degrading endonuclease toxin of MazEF toxin-antitoxin module